MFLFIIAVIDWMQFGLAGVTFITMATALTKSLRDSRNKDKDFSNSVKEMRQELLKEIEKRDIRFIELQEKTLKAMHRTASALEKLQEDINDGQQ